MMTYYDYVEFFNSPLSVLTDDEAYEEWAAENCPDPTDYELSVEYEQLKQNGGI